MEMLSARPWMHRYVKYAGATLGVASLIFVFIPFVLASIPGIGLAILMLGLMAVPVVLIIVYSAQIKQVGLLGTCLVVSDTKRSAHVPLGQVLNVSRTVGG